MSAAMQSPEEPPLFLCIGDLDVDVMIEVDRLPTRDGKVNGVVKQKAPGGMAGNVAAALARLGSRVRVLGRIGDDADGAFAVTSLEQVGTVDDSGDVSTWDNFGPNENPAIGLPDAIAIGPDDAVWYANEANEASLNEIDAYGEARGHAALLARRPGDLSRSAASHTELDAPSLALFERAHRLGLEQERAHLGDARSQPDGDDVSLAPAFGGERDLDGRIGKT